MLTIAVIDKYPIARAGLACFFKSQFNPICIIGAESMIQMKKLYVDQIPDMVILGIGQHADMQNIEMLKTVKKSYPSAKIILYDELLPEMSFPKKQFDTFSDTQSTYLGSELIMRYFHEGANGYLSKCDGILELRNCIVNLLAGKRYLCKPMLELLIYKFLSDPIETVIKPRHLTRREYEIAHYLSEGMKTLEIAKKMDRKASTISTVKKTIFKKLEVDNIIKLRQILNINLSLKAM